VRQFDPFYDPSDLSACVPAGQSVAELNARAKADGIYFPLWRDPSQNFGELYLGTRVCSRSFRFGWLGDNVLGCRFRLKNGKTLDLGGRVVKNVVGLDLTRFLAGSQGLFGEPETLVLRLRPLPELRRELSLEGAPENLERFRAEFMLSPWVHCVDAFDMEQKNSGASASFVLRLGLAYACTFAEAAVFESALKKLADAKGCVLREAPLPTHRNVIERRVPLSQGLSAAKAESGVVTGYLGHGILLLENGPAPEPLPDSDLNARVTALLEGLA
jgi:hypothetical protein